MLKIKDKVNLEVLKSFGFEKDGICYEYQLKRYDHDEPQEVFIIVYLEDFRAYKQRELYLYLGEDLPEDELYKLDILFDLIQAGLVEKVGD